MVGFDEVDDGEVVLAVEDAGASADDLLELDHGVHGAHEDDVAHVAGVHAGGELLGGGQDGRQGLVVILELGQRLVPEVAVGSGDAQAVVQIGRLLVLADQVPDGRRVVHAAAEDDGLLVGVYQAHELLDHELVALAARDPAGELLVAIDLAVLWLALDHLIAGVDGHLVQRGGHLEDLEGR